MDFNPFTFLWPFVGFAVFVGLAFLAFQIWMLVDAVQRPAEHFSPPDARTWWIVGLAVGLALGFVGFAGAVVYFILVRKPAVDGRIAAPVFCPSCRARQHSGARFCHQCGAATTQETI